MKIDLRPRCLRCGKLPRGKQQEENLKRYSPYCSYHCQQWHGLEEAQRHIKTLAPECEIFPGTLDTLNKLCDRGNK